MTATVAHFLRTSGWPRKASYLCWHAIKHRFSERSARVAFSVTGWEPLFQRYQRFFTHQLSFIDFASAADLDHFDYLIPLSRSGFDELQARLPGDSRAIMPSPEVFAVFEDKKQFAEILYGSPFRHLAPSSARIRLPLILKPRIGANSEGCRLITDSAEIPRFTEQLESPDWIVQEYVCGSREYAAHLLVQDGLVLKHLTLEYRFSNPRPIKTLDRPVAKRIVRERYLDEWTRLLKWFGYRGICCINYKIVGDRPVLLEINPRMGGSLCEYFFTFVPALGTSNVEVTKRRAAFQLDRA